MRTTPLSILAILAMLALLLAACGEAADSDPASEGDTCARLDPAFSVPGSDVGERYACISLPEPAAVVTGRFAVGGYTAGAFEQGLVIELRDAAGAVLAMQPVTARAPDLGLVGPWSTELDLPAATPSGPGVLVAYATSARDGSVDFEAMIPVRIVGMAQ